MQRLLHCLIGLCYFIFRKVFQLSWGRKNFFRVFVLLALGNYSLVSAQSFPVQVIPQAIPPAPIYFSSYADANTSSSPLRVQVVLNDFTITNREVRLKVYFQGNGITFQSNDIVVGAPTLFMEGGIPLALTNMELAPYFRFENITGLSPNVYGRAIPEGAYQFCFEIIDVLSGNRLSQKSCATTIIFQNEPPFLVSPYNKTNIEERNPQNIVFQWTPRQLNVSNVEYELSIVEIWDTYVDPQAAFLSSPPIFQTTTSATTYVYGPSDPLFLSNKNYAWRVQAKARQGTEEIGLFKNQGYSEIYSFSYAGVCSLPSAINHEVKGSTNANIFWDDFSTDVPEYTVRYRKKGNNNEWFLNKTTSNTTTLWDLKAGTVYEYQVQKKCVVTQSDWSTVRQFTTFIADDEASVYECGITPDFSLTNTEPLPSITVGEQFTAGDFPIKILEVSGSNGRFTGKGYVTIPYLNSIRVGVEFTNVLINTDKQMAEGTVITMYDPTLANIVDVDVAIDTVTDAYDAVADLGDTVENIIEDVFNRKSDSNENTNEEDWTEESNETQNTETDNESQNETNSNTEATQSPGENTTNSNSGTNGNSDQVGETYINSSNSSSSPEIKEAVISYNGNIYKHGEIIDIDYRRDLERQQFKLLNVLEDAKVVWRIFEQISDTVETEILENGLKIDLDLDNNEQMILESEYWINEKNTNDISNKIRIGVRVIRKEFSLIELYAYHGKQRMATSENKLYLLKRANESESEIFNKIKFGIKISPNLYQNEISDLNLEWYYGSNSHLPQDMAKLSINRNLKIGEEVDKTTVRAGYPIGKDKSVDVIWIDEDYSSNSNVFSNGFDLMPHLKELAKKVGVPVYHEKDKYATDVGFSVLADLGYLTESKNVEDSSSRLYFNETKQTLSTTLGIKGRFEQGIPSLSLPQVKKKFMGVEFEFSAGFYFFIEGSASGKVGFTRYIKDFVEQKEKLNKTYVEYSNPSKISLDAEIGIDPKLIIKASENFSGEISLKSKIKSEIFVYDFANNVFQSPLIEDGFIFKCSPKAQLIIFGYDYSYPMDEFIYEVKW